MQIFQAGIDAVAGEKTVQRQCRIEDQNLLIGRLHYNLSELGRIVVVGAGKASAFMATALEELLGDRIDRGLVNVKYGHLAALHQVELIEAGHPVPDRNGQRGAAAILALAHAAQSKDLLICLMSGGGSALLPLPAEGIDLVDKQAMINTLMACGATIHEINTLRKHTSAIKGGQLARAAYPADLVALILSDVVGDDLDVIASGPTVADSSTFEDAMAVVRKYDLTPKLPPGIMSYLEAGLAGQRPETPKPGDVACASAQNLIIGSNLEALQTARTVAQGLGYNSIILSSTIQGETRDVAAWHAAVAREIRQSGHPVAPPACVLSGGETTVTLQGRGKGGRNQEFALAAAIAIADPQDMVILSGGSDGTDGPTDAAGAIIDATSLSRGRSAGLDPLAHLTNNDAYHFFQPLGDLLFTGPTHTNVMDLRIMLVG
jgi:hydroxypyruvate reductase